MELKIKVELDMTERMSGLVTGLIGLLALPRKPVENNSQGLPEEPESAPRGADHTTDTLQPQPQQPAQAISEKSLPRQEPQPQQQPAQAISEKSLPREEVSEADQLKGVIEVTIAKYAGQDWKENPTPENKKMVLAVSAAMKEIARCVSDQATDKPTALEGQQRVRFTKELDNIYTDSEGKPAWKPF